MYNFISKAGFSGKDLDWKGNVGYVPTKWVENGRSYMAILINKLIMKTLYNPIIEKVKH